MRSKCKVLVKEWLDKAESDYQYAKASFEAFDEFYSQICILCHDAAEKYLKSCLIFLDKKPEKIHDLVTLQKVCSEEEKDNSALLDGIEEECRVLNRYYIPLKYPSHYPPVNKLNAEEAIEAVGKIRQAVNIVVGFTE